jgi:hypothetical protein
MLLVGATPLLVRKKLKRRYRTPATLGQIIYLFRAAQNFKIKVRYLPKFSNGYTIVISQSYTILHGKICIFDQYFDFAQIFKRQYIRVSGCPSAKVDENKYWAKSCPSVAGVR